MPRKGRRATMAKFVRKIMEENPEEPYYDAKGVMQRHNPMDKKKKMRKSVYSM